MTAYGYIRQSRRADLDVALSPDQQRRDIAMLAARDGVDVDEVFEDLGRSGGKGKERFRAGYQDLLNAIVTGGATVIYTKTLTRLGRSVRELYRVLELAEAHGCRIVTMKEGAMDPGTPIGRAQFGMLAVFAEFERDLAVERARDNVAMRRSRGERMGRRTYGTAPGEDPSRIVAAFREAGSYNGAATALARAGVPSMLGRDWTPTAVRVLVMREAPELAPRHARRGAKSAAGFVLNGLLRCACGGTLTGTTSHGGKYVRYHCHRGAHDPAHGPKSVSEAVALPFVREAVERVSMPRIVEREAQDAKRAALEAERDQILAQNRKRWIDDAEAERLLSEVADQLAALDTASALATIPAIGDRWDAWEPAELNAILRSMMKHVQMDDEQRPATVDWRWPVEYIA